MYYFIIFHLSESLIKVGSSFEEKKTGSTNFKLVYKMFSCDTAQMMVQEACGKAVEGKSHYGLFLKCPALLSYPATAVLLHSKLLMGEVNRLESLGRVSSSNIVSISSFLIWCLMVDGALMSMQSRLNPTQSMFG